MKATVNEVGQLKLVPENEFENDWLYQNLGSKRLYSTEDDNCDVDKNFFSCTLVGMTDQEVVEFLGEKEEEKFVAENYPETEETEDDGKDKTIVGDA